MAEPVQVIGNQVVFRRPDGSEFTVDQELLGILGFELPPGLQEEQSKEQELLQLAGIAAGEESASAPVTPTGDGTPVPAAVPPEPAPAQTTAAAPVPEETPPETEVTMPPLKVPRSRTKSVNEAVQQALGVSQAGALQQEEAVQREQEALRGLDPAFVAMQQAIQDEAAAQEAAARAQEEAFSDASKQLAELQSEVEALAAKEPDPSRFWSNRSTFQKIASFIGVIFHALANPRAENATLLAIQREIDRDVELQQQAIERQLRALAARREAIGQQTNLELERIKAGLAARMAKTAAVARLFDLAKTRATNEQQIARLEAAKGQILQNLAKNQMDAATTMANFILQERQLALQNARLRMSAAAAAQPDFSRMVKVPGLGIIPDDTGKPLVAFSEKEAAELRNFAAEWVSMNELLKEYRDLASRVGPGATVKAWFKGEDASRLKQLQNLLARKIARSVMLEKGTMSEGDIKAAEQTVTTVNNLTGQAATGAIEKLRRQIADQFAYHVDAKTTGSAENFRQWVMEQAGDSRVKLIPGAEDVGFQLLGRPAAGLPPFRPPETEEEQRLLGMAELLSQKIEAERRGDAGKAQEIEAQLQELSGSRGEGDLMKMLELVEQQERERQQRQREFEELLKRPISPEQEKHIHR